MKVYAYENCSTCKKALGYLKSTGRDFELKAIRETPPTKAELRKIDEQEKKIQRMQSAITEIVQENIELKKNLGASGLL